MNVMRVTNESAILKLKRVLKVVSLNLLAALAAFAISIDFSVATAETKDDYSPEKTAAHVAAALKDVKTVGDFLVQLRKRTTLEEANGVEQVFSEQGLTPESPFPKVVAKGNKLIFVGTGLTVEYLKDRSFKLNSRVYKAPRRGGLDSLVREVASQNKNR